MRHARMGLGALALLVAVWILIGAFIVAVG
jgi:hypothetical protein